MKKAIGIIILGLLLSGCSGSIKPTMISGDFISTEHGTARTVDVMKGAQEYCELRNKKAKLVRTDCPWRCVSSFECVSK
jgi:hypothetical protein